MSDDNNRIPVMGRVCSSCPVNGLLLTIVAVWKLMRAETKSEYGNMNEFSIIGSKTVYSMHTHDVKDIDPS